MESFTYLGNVVKNSDGSRHEVLRRIGLAHGVMDSLNMSIWRSRYLCRRTKIRIFKSLVFPVVLYGWETFVSNRRLLRETDSSRITCIVRERQLRLYGHVAPYPEVDPAQRFLSVRDNPVWRRPRGRPQLSLLEQFDESCQELLRT